MLELLTIPKHEQFLRQKSLPVDFNDKSYLKDIAQIVEFFKNRDSGYALASIQLGIPKRIVYVRSSNPECNVDEHPMVLINPTITKMEGKTQFWEACFSCVPKNMGLVERPYKISVNYFNEKGEEQNADFEGFPVTVLCHEFDHLDGIFHLDRAKQTTIKETREERVNFRKEYPYTVFSKDGNFVYDLGAVSNIG